MKAFTKVVQAIERQIEAIERGCNCANAVRAEAAGMLQALELQGEERRETQFLWLRLNKAGKE